MWWGSRTIKVPVVVVVGAARAHNPEVIRAIWCPWTRIASQNPR